MGTTSSLSFVCQSQAEADRIAEYVFRTITEYENRFSRFIPDSELSILNTQGRLSTPSPEFIAVFKRCIELAELTGNNFNPLVQVKTLGYNSSLPNTTPGQIHTELPLTYNSDLSLCYLDTTETEIKLGPNQQIDVGGMLKGYLAAKIADEVVAAYKNCVGCIINIGGDLATRGLDELHQPFIFYLYNPITGIETPVPIINQSLATSGTYARKWNTTTGTKNHIVDSQTHENPTTGLVAVSIITDDGSYCEALTKLFLTRGITDATNLLSPQIYNYQYYVVTNEGKTISTITST